MNEKQFSDFINELRKECLKYYKENLVSIVIFGSYAEDKYTPFSDIDLLLILEKAGSNYKMYTEFFSILDNIETIKKLKEKNIFPLISPIIKSKKSLIVELPYLWSASFKIIYDKNNYFKKFLKKLDEFKKHRIEYFEYPIPHYIMKDG
ncbi:MAG TPA: nucleotidyltransferase domain-containing protein [bacterium]|nr:nucleotidyltransferase domain-containing protein [bacterium]HOM27331.1 nucleotidyltransferase domain-containing protein [bacterium]